MGVGARVLPAEGPRLGLLGVVGERQGDPCGWTGEREGKAVGGGGDGGALQVGDSLSE